ncbi:M60 family metallopeptidase [Sphingobacterium oryzagri]|uniref:M60 family metallopeptidase n=1 Tax=Sphingobacterium oryzagri TaxID=3025669 RepID=A0ABY7WKA4_9SPHI|nr:M60 family metallopeptidase [Sphingobacterium sp. KACC 22765]WDF68833.1 M60 family metallopeptidase [Sphingobacterium sp. KACC 22765]
MKKNIFYLLVASVLVGFSSCEKAVTSIEAASSAAIEQTLAIADSVQTFSVTPSATTETDRMRFRGNHNEMQATGFYAAPNSVVTIKTTVKSGTTPIRLAIGTPFRDNVRPVRQYFNLQEGTQSFTIDQYGGLVYIIYTANNYSSTGQVEITFGDGFVAVPYFQKGKTSQSQWQETLNALKDDVPDVVFSSDHTIMVANMEKALLYQNEDQNLIVDRLDAIIDFSNKISGLSGNSGVHAVPYNKHLITVRDAASGGYMAAGIAIYYTESLSYRLLQPLYLSNVNGWGMWHEVGHTYQQNAWTWTGMTETTVNVYSLASERGFGLSPSRITTNNSWHKLDTYLQKPVVDRNFNQGDVELKLIMFHQLQLAFGDEVFIQLSRSTRENRPNVSTDEEKMRYFMLTVAQVTQKNLSDFFRKWGFKVNQSVYDELDAFGFPAPDQDLTTLRD